MEAEKKQKAVEAIVFAGPNGSGKSTITRLLRPRNVDYINADDIKKVLGSDVCNIYDNSFDYPVRFFNKKKDRYYYEEVPLWNLAAIESLIDIHDGRLQRRDLNSRNPFAAEVLKK